MKEIRVGIAGLGRLGKVHAENLAFHIPGVRLTAACSIVSEELSFARERLGAAFPTTTRCFPRRSWTPWSS